MRRREPGRSRRFSGRLRGVTEGRDGKDEDEDEDEDEEKDEEEEEVVFSDDDSQEYALGSSESGESGEGGDFLVDGRNFYFFRPAPQESFSPTPLS